ncbi:MAG: hypothetical protein WCR49_15575, partial [Opitutae bacterium]
MTLRARLAWAFSTMLLVPMLLVILLSGIVQGFWMPQDEMAAVGVLNRAVLDDPDGLLRAEGFGKLTEVLPPVVVVGLQSGGVWRQTSPGFVTSEPHEHQRTLFEWQLRLTDGSLALLEVRLFPHQFWAEGNRWFLVFPILGLLVLILTNGTLTWLVSRSILRPLGQLEVAARRLQFLPWQVLQAEDHWEAMGRLSEWGFAPMPARTEGDLDSMIAFLAEQQTARLRLPFDTDGLVIKVRD